MTISISPTADASVTKDDPIRVMIVDDSIVIRGVISSWITEEPELHVVATHRNGRRAADDMVRAQPDVVILDIEMPEMDGLTALPLILERRPGTAVIVASTLTRRGAEVSLKALTLGAADYIPKPDALAGQASAAEFRQDLIAKVRHLGARARRVAARQLARRAAPTAEAPATGVATRARPPAAGRTRPFSAAPVKVVAIGSSTGGPQALTRIFAEFGPAMGHVPVLVVQHMPPTFTAILAEHIGRAAGRPAAEGSDGEAIQPGHVYVAPGGKHMLVEKLADRTVIRLSDAPPVNFCRPAVDPMFEAAAQAYGSGVFGVVLTGMGSDGAKGALQIADAGGSIIAQDEATSVVWGMPGATVAIGACAGILPIDEIGQRIARALSGGRA
jgi:two-component system chemotaxis response regulator CheB